MLSKEESMRRLLKIDSRLIEIQKEIDILSSVYTQRSELLSKAIESDVSQRIQEEHEQFMHEYLKRVGSLRKSIESLTRKKNIFLQDNKIKKAYTKHSRSVFIQKQIDLHRKGGIDQNMLSILQESLDKGNGKIRYSDTLCFRPDGRFLVVQRSSKDSGNPLRWVIPGGHVDVNENHRQAAARELFEETGIRVADDKFHLAAKYQNSKVCIEYYRVFIDEMEPTILLDDNETHDYDWVYIDELIDVEMVFNMKENLQKMLGFGNIVQDLNKAEKFDIIENEKNMADQTKKLIGLSRLYLEGKISKDTLEKGLKGLGHLVPKRVQVKGKGGKIYQAIRWVSPDTQEPEKITQAKNNHAAPTGDLNADIAAVINSSLTGMDKMKNLINLGIYDLPLLNALSGTSYTNYHLKNKMGLDVSTLQKTESDNTKQVKEAIREEQKTMDTPEGREKSQLLRPIEDVDALWRTYEKNLKRVITGRHKFAIAYGTGGVGKTYTFEQLAEKPKSEGGYELREFSEEIQPSRDQYDYVVVKGRIAVTQVYAEMYRHRDKLIVFDDCDSFLSMPEVQGFLKGGLDTGKKTQISNKSPKKIYNIEGDPDSGTIPNTFNFTGRVIAITNLSAKDIDQAVKSRALVTNLTMTVDETVRKLNDIVDAIKIYEADKATVIPVSQEARDFAFDVLKENKDMLGGDINTRVLSNAILIAQDGIEAGDSPKDIKLEIRQNFEGVTGSFDDIVRLSTKKK